MGTAQLQDPVREASYCITLNCFDWEKKKKLPIIFSQNLYLTLDTLNQEDLRGTKGWVSLSKDALTWRNQSQQGMGPLAVKEVGALNSRQTRGWGGGLGVLASAS